LEANPASQPPSAKPGRGWVGLNISAVKVRDLRALCKVRGITFRLFCEHAIVAARSRMEEDLGVNARQLAGMSEAELERLHARAELLRTLESSRSFSRQRGQSN
jgi:hypothetical protein